MGDSIDFIGELCTQRFFLLAIYVCWGKEKSEVLEYRGGQYGNCGEGRGSTRRGKIQSRMIT